MIRNVLEGRVQARILTAVTAAAVAIGGAILIPGVANAATTTQGPGKFEICPDWSVVGS